MILHADARHIPLASESVHCVVTSPPYWGLRDYGVEPSVWGEDKRIEKRIGKRGAIYEPCQHEWGEEQVAESNSPQGAFCLLCSAWRGVLGLEPTPELYVEHMVEIFREIRRVLRKDSTCWVNLGDSYTGGANSGGANQNDGGQPHRIVGLKPKDLVGIPWRVGFALQADGWWLRSDIIWSKPNPMPESVTDRPTKSHEYIFLLTRSATYYFDQDAVREPAEYAGENGSRPQTYRSDPTGLSCPDFLTNPNRYYPQTRNIRTVWTMPTEAFPDAHFATFPSELAMRCVLAGSPLDGWRLEERRSSDWDCKMQYS